MTMRKIPPVLMQPETISDGCKPVYYEEDKTMIKTITIDEIKASTINTYSVKDNSPRGIHTAYKKDIKAGDIILINDYFYKVIENNEK